MAVDGNQVTKHVPVQFKVDRWAGTAGSLDVDVQAEMIHLAQKIDATMAPETPADAPMHVLADDGVYHRHEGNVDFNGSVVMTHDRDLFNSAQLHGQFGTDPPTPTPPDRHRSVLPPPSAT